jgi:hypothetical protein
MIRDSLTALFIFAAASLLVACNTPNATYNEKLNQDEYLKRNYPGSEPKEKQKPRNKSGYYEDTTFGQSVISSDEHRIFPPNT